MRKSVCRTTIQNTLWAIEDAIKAENEKNFVFDYNSVCRTIAPLEWYITTDRAPTEFLEIFVNTGKRQHTAIAKRLVKAGTDEEAINAVCKFLKFKRESI